MEFIETKLRGSFLVKLRKIEDVRGYFSRAWCRHEFAEHGLNPNMVQLNVGFSPKNGTLRGLHFQRSPHDEAKFIRCTRGAIFDVIVDLRPGSPTQFQWYGIELTENNGTMLYAPEGFAHGYQTLKEDSEMYYLTSREFAREHASGVRFDDPAFKITWPLPVSIISEQDQRWPLCTV